MIDNFKQDTQGGSISESPQNKLRILNLADREDSVHRPKKRGDIGYDLVVSKNTWVLPSFWRMGRSQLIPCAARFKIPDNMFCQIMARSSSSNKKRLLIHTAVIDENYTGRLFACVFNLSLFPKKIKKGERLAQAVFFKSYTPTILNVDTLPGTERGEEGFGSTGE